MAYEQFIVETKHRKVQERLLEKSKLTLSKTINIARTYEATVSQMEQLEGKNNTDILGIKGNNIENDNKTKKCPNCGLKHPSRPRSKCPPYGSLCLNYQKENNWARVCSSRTQGGTRGRQRNRENNRLHHHSRSKLTQQSKIHK